jgi:hypothetical protein
LHGRPLAEAEDYGVGRWLKTRAILSPSGEVVKVIPGKFTLNFA